MQPIQGYDQLEARHGGFSALKAGGYVMLIQGAKEDVTGYGNPCLKITYDIAEGPEAGRFAAISADPEQNWRHEFEIDTAEAGGARLKALTDAVAASNPGYAWDWNEAGLVGRYVGVILQERITTATRGRNKGRDRTYLDFWDAVPIDAIRSGQFSVPPVNDKRDPAVLAARAAQAQAPAPQPPTPPAPVAAQQATPQGYQQAPAPYAQQPQPAPVAAPPAAPAPQAPAPAPVAQPPAGAPQMAAPAAQAAPAYAAQAQVAPAPVAPAPGQVDLYDEDIPF